MTSETCTTLFKARLTERPRGSHTREARKVVVRAKGAERRLGSPALGADPEVDLVADEGAEVEGDVGQG